MHWFEYWRSGRAHKSGVVAFFGRIKFSTCHQPIGAGGLNINRPETAEPVACDSDDRDKSLGSKTKPYDEMLVMAWIGVSYKKIEGVVTKQIDKDCRGRFIEIGLPAFLETCSFKSKWSIRQ